MPVPARIETKLYWMHDRIRAAGLPGEPDEPDEPDGGGDEEREREGETAVEDEPELASPRRYKVIFHNDDFTTMEFVVEVLTRFFRKTETEAMHIMLTVHKMGAAVVLVTTRDVAETKAAQVMDYARENGMPLLVTTEPE